MPSSGACDKDAPDPVEAVLSGREAEQEGQVHQGRKEALLAMMLLLQSMFDDGVDVVDVGALREAEQEGQVYQGREDFVS